MWQHTKYSRKLDETFPTFAKYRNSLRLRCDNGSEPGHLEFSPNTSWPDVVYYGSWVVGNMGWKIHIVDSLTSSASRSIIIDSYLLSSSFLLIYLFIKHFYQN